MSSDIIWPIGGQGYVTVWYQSGSFDTETEWDKQVEWIQDYNMVYNIFVFLEN